MRQFSFAIYLFVFLLSANICYAAEKFVLIISLYHEKKEERIAEYKKCLQENLAHPLIDKIVVFFDTREPDPENRLLGFIQTLPVKIFSGKGRPSLELLLHVTNTLFPQQNIILANGDIYFNETLSKLSAIDLSNTFVALTRHNELEDGTLALQGYNKWHGESSQDAWVFRSPLTLKGAQSIIFGTWQCDGKIAKAAFLNGLQVINPCKDVQAIHVHSSDVRNYSVPQKKDVPIEVIRDVCIPHGTFNSFYQKQPAQTPRVSVITKISDEDDVEEFLTSLASTANAHELEVIFFDTRSHSNELRKKGVFQKIQHHDIDQEVGQGAILNRGVEYAHAPYIIKVDASCRFGQYFFEFLARELERNEQVDAVYSGYQDVLSIQREYYDSFQAPSTVRYKNYMPNERLLNTVMWKKTVHSKIGLFDESFNYLSDLEFWVRALQGGCALVRSEPDLIAYPQRKMQQSEGYTIELTSIYKKLQTIPFDGVRYPRVSILTSVYNADQFIEGFLEDITHQTIFEQCELLLINADSPGNEYPAIEPYLKKFPNIFYEKLDSDPGLYGVWNYALRKARARYVTNANVDDRLAYDCYEKHAALLDENPSIALVYSDHYVSTEPNLDFEYAKEHNFKVWNYPQFHKEEIYFNSLPNSHPMWRKSMHAKAGYFDASYKSAGDWQMWIRAVGFGCTFKKLDEVLGVFYLNQDGLSHSEDNVREVDAIRKKIGVKTLYQTENLWQSMPRDPATGRLLGIKVR